MQSLDIIIGTLNELQQQYTLKEKDRFYEVTNYSY